MACRPGRGPRALKALAAGASRPPRGHELWSFRLREAAAGRRARPAGRKAPQAACPVRPAASPAPSEAVRRACLAGAARPAARSLGLVQDPLERRAARRAPWEPLPGRSTASRGPPARCPPARPPAPPGRRRLRPATPAPILSRCPGQPMAARPTVCRCDRPRTYG